MKIITTKDYDEFSKKAAAILADAINENPTINLGLATGNTPLGLYKELVKLYQDGKVDFSEVTTFNLDEYVGLSMDDKNSYSYYMYENLYNHVNIKEENINLMNGAASNLEEELNRFQKKIEAVGGIDLQIDGLGENGHVGFNEPASELKLRGNVASLTESTINANEHLFDHIEDVPTLAMTLGIADILETKKMIVLVNGAHKAKAVKAFIDSDIITTQNPSTFLKLHPNLTVILDEEAASLL